MLAPFPHGLGPAFFLHAAHLIKGNPAFACRGLLKCHSYFCTKLCQVKLAPGDPSYEISVECRLSKVARSLPFGPENSTEGGKKATMLGGWKACCRPGQCPALAQLKIGFPPALTDFFAGISPPQLELSALQSVVSSQEEELQVQASDVESLTRNIQIKEELIKVGLGKTGSLFTFCRHQSFAIQIRL